MLTSTWIHNVVGAQRTFSYVQPFPTSDAACAVPPFKRTFEHRDWFDGQSVVQAQETPDEAGFNARFHQIETDLDRLGGDVATLVPCLEAGVTTLGRWRRRRLRSSWTCSWSTACGPLWPGGGVGRVRAHAHASPVRTPTAAPRCADAGPWRLTQGGRRTRRRTGGPRRPGR